MLPSVKDMDVCSGRRLECVEHRQDVKKESVWRERSLGKWVVVSSTVRVSITPIYTILYVLLMSSTVPGW